MGEQIPWILDVAHGEELQLLEPVAAGGMDGE